MGITNYVKGQSFHGAGSVDPFAGLCSTEDQPVIQAGVPQSITFNVHFFDPIVGFDHFIAVANDEITLPPGIDTLEAQLELQLTNGASNNQLTIYAEMSEDGGPWVAIPLTGTTAVMPPNSSLILPHNRTTKIANGARKNKIRIRMLGDSTNLSLEATDPSGGVPGIPSAIFNLAAR